MANATKKQIKEFSDTSKYPTMTTIKDERQKYVDHPIYEVISKARELSLAMARIFGKRLAPKIEELVRYERHILAWNRD